MNTQNYANHARIDKGFHGLLFFFLLAGLIGSVINLVNAGKHDGNLYSASLILFLFVCASLLAYYSRVFALKAQDRAIRAEENLRHLAITGKLLDSRLRLSQIIALRFAPNDEFVELAHKAAEENLPAKEIKRQIKNWKADHHRV